MRLVSRLALAMVVVCFSLSVFVATSSASTKSATHSVDPTLGLESDALKDQSSKNPFVAEGELYHLSFSKANNPKIEFPKTLNAGTPIILHTKFGIAKQFIVSKETYQAELYGRYLIYRGVKNSILYRFDADKNSLREFVYLKDASALPKDGEVIEWRFEGAELQSMPDGSVALTKTVDIKSEVRKVSNDAMAERIQKFMVKQQGVPLKGVSAIQILFTISKPEYIDGNRNTHTAGIRYTVADNKLALHLENNASLVYPLWVDPSLTADADANVILDGPGIGDWFAVSVASAGDFNGDGKDDQHPRLLGVYTVRRCEFLRGAGCLGHLVPSVLPPANGCRGLRR